MSMFKTAGERDAYFQKLAEELVDKRIQEEEGCEPEEDESGVEEAKAEDEEDKEDAKEASEETDCVMEKIASWMDKEAGVKSVIDNYIGNVSGKTLKGAEVEFEKATNLNSLHKNTRSPGFGDHAEKKLAEATAVRDAAKASKDKALTGTAIASAGAGTATAGTAYAVNKKKQEKCAEYLQEAQLVKQAAYEALMEADLIEKAAMEVLEETGYFGNIEE